MTCPSGTISTTSAKKRAGNKRKSSADSNNSLNKVPKPSHLRKAKPNKKLPPNVVSLYSTSSGPAKTVKLSHTRFLEGTGGEGILRNLLMQKSEESGHLQSQTPSASKPQIVLTSQCNTRLIYTKGRLVPSIMPVTGNVLNYTTTALAQNGNQRQMNEVNSRSSKPIDMKSDITQNVAKVTDACTLALSIGSNVGEDSSKNRFQTIGARFVNGDFSTSKSLYRSDNELEQVINRPRSEIITPASSNESNGTSSTNIIITPILTNQNDIRLLYNPSQSAQQLKFGIQNT